MPLPPHPSCARAVRGVPPPALARAQRYFWNVCNTYDTEKKKPKYANQHELPFKRKRLHEIENLQNQVTKGTTAWAQNSCGVRHVASVTNSPSLPPRFVYTRRAPWMLRCTSRIDSVCRSAWHSRRARRRAVQQRAGALPDGVMKISSEVFTTYYTAVAISRVATEEKRLLNCSVVGGQLAVVPVVPRSTLLERLAARRAVRSLSQCRSAKTRPKAKGVL